MRNALVALALTVAAAGPALATDQHFFTVVGTQASPGVVRHVTVKDLSNTTIQPRGAINADTIQQADMALSETEAQQLADAVELWATDAGGSGLLFQKFRSTPVAIYKLRAVVVPVIGGGTRLRMTLTSTTYYVAGEFEPNGVVASVLSTQEMQLTKAEALTFAENLSDWIAGGSFPNELIFSKAVSE